MDPIITKISEQEFQVLGLFDVYQIDSDWYVKGENFSGAKFIDKYDALRWASIVAVDRLHGESIRELLLMGVKERKDNA